MYRPEKPEDPIHLRFAEAMKALPYDRMGMSIRLMLGTGMRTQEIMALEPKHIEEDGSCIHIRQAVTMVKGSPKIGPPKTKTSYRDIPVPSHLREIAQEFRNTSEQFIWHGEEVPICNPSVFRLHVQKEVKEDAAQKLDSLFKKGKQILHIA